MIGEIHYPDLVFPFWPLLVAVLALYVIFAIVMLIFVHKRFNREDAFCGYLLGALPLAFIAIFTSGMWVAGQEGKVRDLYLEEKGYSNIQVDGDQFTASDPDGKYVLGDLVRDDGVTYVYERVTE